MRFLSLLFALYFAVLGCLPCTDDVPPANQESACVVQAGHAPADSPSHADWCSPLCQCSCCFVPAMLPARLTLAGAAPMRPTWAVRQFAAVLAHPLPVRALATPWQPPQGA